MRAANYRTRFVVKLTFQNKEEAEECRKRIDKVAECRRQTGGTPPPLWNGLLASALAPCLNSEVEQEEQL